MSGPIKPRKLTDDPPADFAPGIDYRPCKFCSSLDYDIADGSVDDKNIFEPETCDVCAFGEIKLSSIPIH